MNSQVNSHKHWRRINTNSSKILPKSRRGGNISGKYAIMWKDTENMLNDSCYSKRLYFIWFQIYSDRKYISGCLGLGAIAEVYKVSLELDENVLKLIVMIIVQLGYYSTNHELYTLNEWILWYPSYILIKSHTLK